MKGETWGLNIRDESQSGHLQPPPPHTLTHTPTHPTGAQLARMHGCQRQQWAGCEKQSNCDHTVAAGSNNLIIMTSVAGQFPVSGLVIYCALRARRRPRTLCLLTAIIGAMLPRCQDRCTRHAIDHLRHAYEIGGQRRVFTTGFGESL